MLYKVPPIFFFFFVLGAGGGVKNRKGGKMRVNVLYFSTKVRCWWHIKSVITYSPADW